MKLNPELAAEIERRASKVVAVKMPEPTPQPPKRLKMGNVPTQDGEIKFQSKKEAVRWQVLIDKQRRGKICFLRRQVGFRIAVNGVHVCFYRADFVYIEDGKQVVEDVKGFKTAIYKLKKKLMKAVLGIEIRET